MSSVPASSPSDLELSDVLSAFALHWRKLAVAPLAIAIAAYGSTYLVDPTFTGRTTFLPPQQQQSSATSMLASLGALSGLVGATSLKSPADQYVALLQSHNVADKIIDQFGLMKVYDVKYRAQAREELDRRTQIVLGKKDGLITVRVDANDAKLAADMANSYVTELRRLSSELALTEAQQRRSLFERELQRTRQQLTAAQSRLEQSGFNPGALKTEPRVAADTYAKLKAELTTAKVHLQTMRLGLSESASEVQQQLARINALQSQLQATEQSGGSSRSADADYVSSYREFKYQEMLMELFAKQYELARVDEAKEGATIQVIDSAHPPERKSKPQRVLIALGAWAISLALLMIGLVAGSAWRVVTSRPEKADQLHRIRNALRRQA